MSMLFRALTISSLLLALVSAASKPEYTAYQLGGQTKLTIDGDLSDWPDLPFFVLGAQDQVASGNWSGPQDTFAKVRMAWDSDTLYMAIEVIDDSIVRKKTRSEAVRIFREDSIQWAVDLKNDGGTGYGDDNYEYGFGMADGEPVVYRWYSSSGWPKGIAEHVDLAVVPHPQGGSIYEAAVNFSMLAPLRNPDDGRTIGFTIVLQDRDTANYKTLQWTPGVTTGKDPSLFGKLVFSTASPSLEGGWLISAGQTVGHEGLAVRLISAAPGSTAEAPVVRVVDEAGKVKNEVPLEPVEKQKTAFTAAVPTRDLVPGDYTIRVMDQNGDLLAEHDFTRSDTTRLQNLMDALPERIATLEARMKEAQANGVQTHYARNAVAAARLFLGYSREDVEAQLYDLALHNIDAVTNAVSRELNRLNAWMESDDGMPAWVRVPERDYTQVEIDGSHLVADGEKVLLVGPLGYTWGVRRDIEPIAGAGFNAVRAGLGAHHFFDDNGRMKTLKEQPLWPTSDILKAAQSLNLSAGVGVLPAKVWQGAGRRGKLTLDTFHKIYDRYLKRLTRVTRKRVFDYTISVEGQRSPVEYESKHHRGIWIDYLKSAYESVDELNALYGSEYASFEEVPFAESLPENPARKYDYTRLRQIMIADELAWAADRIRSRDPDAAVTGYPYVWTFRDAAAYYEHAIDPELDADCMDIVSCDTSGSYETDRYAMPTIQWMAGYYALMESIAGDRPLFDGEFHYTNRRKIYPDNWSRSIYFHAYMNGLNGSYSWVWVRSPSIGAALLLDANVLLGSGRASLDLQRVAKEIAAFQDRPADVVLLYSNASSPHSRRVEETVLSQRSQTDRIFEGIYFDGLKVGYVTERMLQQGDIRADKPLIIPNSSHVQKATRQAVLQFARSGGRVLMAGDCLQYTPQAAEYPAFPDLDTVTHVNGFASVDEARDTVVPYLRSLDVEADHRPAVENGQSFPTVEWRCATDADGRRLMFLHNFGHSKARVTLPPAFRGSMDLLTGNVVDTDLELDSLEFMLLRRN